MQTAEGEGNSTFYESSTSPQGKILNAGYQCEPCKGEENLHYLVHVPEDGVRVESLGGIEPEIDPMFSVSLASCEHIRLQNVGLPAPVPQELEVYFIMLRVL